jgi:hypothetical protein
MPKIIVIGSIVFDDPTAEASTGDSIAVDYRGTRYTAA